MLLTDVAVAAVRPICPEAVATLLAWLSASDQTVRRHPKILVEWRLHLPVRVPTNQEKRIRSIYGFRALGSAARSALLAVVAIALNTPDEWQRGDAINALTDPDAEAMGVLARAS
jgi:hypothetical protein